MHHPNKLNGHSAQGIALPIHAELTGSERCEALGIGVHSSTPVLALCRKLLESGCDPTTPLEAWRGSLLCLHVRTIGEAAALEVNPKGNGFIRYRAGRAGSPVAALRNSDRNLGTARTRQWATPEYFPDGGAA